jgi:hypothetical protein
LRLRSFNWRMLSSGATSITAIINIHAKFRKTFLMNDRSPWLLLNHKHLGGPGLLQNSLS